MVEVPKKATEVLALRRLQPAGEFLQRCTGAPSVVKEQEHSVTWAKTGTQGLELVGTELLNGRSALDRYTLDEPLRVIWGAGAPETQELSKDPVETA
jgi:hypothetical protein